MHPLLQYIHDEIHSWDYDSPAGLTRSVAALLRTVLDSGGQRDDLPDFVALYETLSDFPCNDLDEIHNSLELWDNATGSEQLSASDSGDRMLSFKIGCVWVLSRSLMLFFNPDEKLDTFSQWQEFAIKNVENIPGHFLRLKTKTTETSHFWAGNFASLESFTQLFVESCPDDDFDAPISVFANTQSEIFYDHDFLEYGFSDDAKSLSELVDGCSYADKWLKQFAKLIEFAGLANVNAFLLISEFEIEHPQSFETEFGSMTYLGKLTYKI